MARWLDHNCYNRYMAYPIINFFKKLFTSNLSLAFIGVVILLFLSYASFYIQAEQQRAAIERQTSRTDQLIIEIKALSEENRSLNKQNRDYAYCNSVLFAKYTQDQKPIVIDDLQKCGFSSYDREVSSPQVQSNTPAFLAPQTAPQPSQRPATPPASNNAPSSPAQPSQMTPTPQNSPLCLEALQIIKTCK